MDAKRGRAAQPCETARFDGTINRWVIDKNKFSEFRFALGYDKQKTGYTEDQSSSTFNSSFARLEAVAIHKEKLTFTSAAGFSEQINNWIRLSQWRHFKMAHPVDRLLFLDHTVNQLDRVLPPQLPIDLDERNINQIYETTLSCLTAQQERQWFRWLVGPTKYNAQIDILKTKLKKWKEAALSATKDAAPLQEIILRYEAALRDSKRDQEGGGINIATILGDLATIDKHKDNREYEQIRSFAEEHITTYIFSSQFSLYRKYLEIQADITAQKHKKNPSYTTSIDALNILKQSTDPHDKHTPFNIFNKMVKDKIVELETIYSSPSITQSRAEVKLGASPTSPRTRSSSPPSSVSSSFSPPSSVGSPLSSPLSSPRAPILAASTASVSTTLAARLPRNGVLSRRKTTTHENGENKQNKETKEPEIPKRDSLPPASSDDTKEDKSELVKQIAYLAKDYLTKRQNITEKEFKNVQEGLSIKTEEISHDSFATEAARIVNKKRWRNISEHDSYKIAFMMRIYIATKNYDKAGSEQEKAIAYTKIEELLKQAITHLFVEQGKYQRPKRYCESLLALSMIAKMKLAKESEGYLSIFNNEAGLIKGIAEDAVKRQPKRLTAR